MRTRVQMLSLTGAERQGTELKEREKKKKQLHFKVISTNNKQN